MAVGEEGRELGFERDLALCPLAPSLDQGRVGGDAVDPAPLGGVSGRSALALPLRRRPDLDARDLFEDLDRRDLVQVP